MEGLLKLGMFICQLVFENSEHIFPCGKGNLVSGDWIFRPVYSSLFIESEGPKKTPSHMVVLVGKRVTDPSRLLNYMV